MVEETLPEEITNDIETSKKPKKPRSEAQKVAFEKAWKALVEKRVAKAASKPLGSTPEAAKICLGG